MDVRISYQTAEFDRLARLFSGSPELFGKAMRSALRRAGANMRKNVRKGMRAVSYLKARDITRALGRLQLSGDEAVLTVYGAQLAGFRFKMIPNRITARKGMRSVSWPSPGVQIGPGEPVRYPRRAGFSKPFIASIKGLKAMYWREKASGDLKMPPVVSPQYFAAFDRVRDPVMTEAEKTFLTRLEHEIDYRLKLS